MRTINFFGDFMKNKLSGKKIGSILSVIAALAVAIVFWLVVNYIDSGAYNNVDGNASISDSEQG